MLTNSTDEKILYGGEPQTTNNRMELMAAIRGLEALSRSCSVTLVTDSKYLINGITQWMHGWKRNGWRTASKLPVKNAELWRRLDDVVQKKHAIDWQWVKGHSDDKYNDRADALANRGIDELENNE